ncbi:MAG: prepilin peptidase [Candidatus Micrarchaeia archaeon]
MFLELLRMGTLLVVVVLYAIFDLFNKREVPDAFVYAALAIGVLLTFTYPKTTVEISLLVAVAVAAIGYVIYRAGFWGAGDFFELTTISLILPIQPRPLLVSVDQLGIPFVVSFFISTGLAAIWIVPIYYLLVNREKTNTKTKTQPIYKILGVLLITIYLMLLLFVYSLFGISWLRLLIIAAIGIPSAIILAYEEEITDKMTRLVPAKELTEGDIIAVNLMQSSEIRYFASKYKNFGRLVTKEMAKELRHVDRKLPVYRHAAPFAVFVLIGVVVSLLFGNIILFIL